MIRSNEGIDLAIGKILNARVSLKEAQHEARLLMADTIHEMGEVKFRPSVYWQRKMDEGMEGALVEALVEESVTIEYDNSLEYGRKSGYVTGLREAEDGRIEISVMEFESLKPESVSGDDTMDTDKLLEFISAFAE